MSETDYVQGSRAAWSAMLQMCLRELGYTSPDTHRLISEREAAIAELRQVCAVYGDNDWHSNLHLADIIEKHLARHLGDYAISNPPSPP